MREACRRQPSSISSRPPCRSMQALWKTVIRGQASTEAVTKLGQYSCSEAAKVHQPKFYTTGSLTYRSQHHDMLQALCGTQRHP
jgi:hypothetical protein